MPDFYSITTPQSVEATVDLFRHAIDYRNTHKQESKTVALFIFNTTFGSPLDKNLEDIRFEFGALEAPGSPEVAMDLDEFEDRLWERLAVIVSKASPEKVGL